MKTTSPKTLFLLGCGVVLALLVVLLIWLSRTAFVFLAPEGAFPEVNARQLEDPSGTAVVVELELSGEKSGYRITDLSLSRHLAQSLGLSAPEDFTEEPLPLASSERDDPEIVRFVEQFNAENIRWIGDLEILPATPIVLRIPASDPLAEAGPLDIGYERSTGLGGHASGTRLVLNEARNGDGG